jgi:hypothetical protein
MPNKNWTRKEIKKAKVYFMLPRMRRYEKSQFQCSITSLLLVLEQKLVFIGYRKSYPRN